MGLLEHHVTQHVKSCVREGRLWWLWGHLITPKSLVAGIPLTV